MRKDRTVRLRAPVKGAGRLERPFQTGPGLTRGARPGPGLLWCCSHHRPGSPGPVARAGFLSTPSSGSCEVADCLWALRSLAIKEQHGQHADIAAIPLESNKLTLFSPCDLPNDLGHHLPQSLSGVLRTSSSMVWGHTPGKTSKPPEKLQKKGALSTLPSHAEGLEVHRALWGLTSPPDPPDPPDPRPAQQGHCGAGQAAGPLSHAPVTD